MPQDKINPRAVIEEMIEIINDNRAMGMETPTGRISELVQPVHDAVNEWRVTDLGSIPTEDLWWLDMFKVSLLYPIYLVAGALSGLGAITSVSDYIQRTDINLVNALTAAYNLGRGGGKELDGLLSDLDLRFD